MIEKQCVTRSGPQQLFYTEAFKQKIINAVLHCKPSKRQAQLIYGIKDNATFLYWINQSRGLHGCEKRRTQIGNIAEVNCLRDSVRDQEGNNTAIDIPWRKRCSILL